MDDLRVYLKRMEPPITASDTYDKVRSRLVNADEFQALDSEELRRSAFDKHIRRLREREDEAERGGPRRGSVDRDGPRRGSERDRSRGGERSHRGGGGGGGRRRSRSPAPDPYEADRRRAIAEREKNHRKSTMAENLISGERGSGGSGSGSGRLSPRRERDRDHDRAPRSRRDEESYYDRERRDREEARERQSRRRADKGSYDELPYGDDRPTSGARRRRPEDEDDYDRRDSRDSKVCICPANPFTGQLSSQNKYANCHSVSEEIVLLLARPSPRLPLTLPLPLQRLLLPRPRMP